MYIYIFVLCIYIYIYSSYYIYNSPFTPNYNPNYIQVLANSSLRQHECFQSWISYFDQAHDEISCSIPGWDGAALCCGCGGPESSVIQ